MNKILWFIVIVFSAFIVYFITLNRSHAKIQEAIIVAITGLTAVVFGVILFSSDNEEINKEISTVYFVSLEKKEPVFFTAPVLMHYLMGPAIIWGDFVKNSPEEAKKVFTNIPNDFNPLVDLQVASFLQHLSQNYRFEWNIKRTKKSLPGFSSIRGRCLDQNNKDKEIFNKTNQFPELTKNIFFNSLVQNLQVTLPKGSKISYIPVREKSNSCCIKITKKFSYDAEITIYFTSYSAGLGMVGNYVGLTSPTNIWNVNWNERDRFGTVVLETVCKAKFFKLKSGNPDVIKYKIWLKNLFDDLYETFDWSVCESEMRQYNEDLASQKIVSSLGKGFEQKPIVEPGSVVSKQITIENKEEKK